MFLASWEEFESLDVPAVTVSPALAGGHPVPVVPVLALGEAVHTQHTRGVLPAVPERCQ